MTTVADLVTETQRHLSGAHRAQFNALQAGVITTPAAGTTETWTFAHALNGVTPGSVLSVDDEMVYVWDTTPAQNVATIMRGHLGSTIAAHAAGALVEVNARFPKFMIRSSLQEEIRSWGPQVFRVANYVFPVKMNQQGYDLAAIVPFYSVLDVTASAQLNAGQPDPLTWDKVPWKIMQAAPVTDFPSGAMIQLGKTWAASIPTLPEPNINVVYAAPFNVDTFTDGVDVLGAIGIPKEWLDIPAYGAAWRMLSVREVIRTAVESQGMPGDLSMVPAGYVMKTAMQLKAIRDSRLADAEWQLRVKWPIRGAK